MEQPKLTRNNSSLLRSVPTARSSILGLTSAAAGEELIPPEKKPESEERRKLLQRSGSTPRRSGSARVSPVFTLISLAFFSIFSLFFFFFFYLRREEIPTSENLLLALIFIAITLFFASKNRSLINRNFTVAKQLWEENAGKLCFPSPKTKSKPVQWFIGEANGDGETKIREEKSIVREGVEFYSNGDFYEGEFHRGKCNGSGVYNYFVKGRYEGDWIDGRYDGYGVESWARGSRYRGQYRGGLRHGYGVYKFYTGDCYAGEWFNGQSHGVGVQRCSDGSCYVGEFKCGVKHGLGVYHFRNGDRYAGEYFGDKIHGFGVYHFANGHCYEGSWHEGKKQGYGLYTFRKSDAKCGKWDSGILKNPMSPTEPVLKTIMAARRAAESAINLRRVDEQVERAVQGANRAATAARVAAIKAVQNRMDGKFCDTNV